MKPLRIAIFLVTVALIIVPMHSRRKFALPKPKAVAESTASQNFIDVSNLPADSIGITLSGYDKAASASVESMLITNHRDATLSGIKIELVYHTLDGSMIDRRQVTINNLSIAPGETGMATFKSFDRHKSYRYRLTGSNRSHAQPFDVSIRILAIALTGL